MACWNVIDHTELSGNATEYEKTSIPSSYDHLYFVMSARSDDVVTQSFDECDIRLNGDTGSNYTYTQIDAGSSTPSSGDLSASGQLGFQYVPGPNTLADGFGTYKLWIPNYANTSNYKQVLSKWTCPNTSITDWQWRVGMVAGLWASTAAVNAFKIYPSGGDNFVQYSSFTLYGINGAG